MKELRSTLALVVVLAGLVGYIYYRNNREATPEDAKEKAFAAIKAEDIEEVQITLADGQAARVQKADGTWKVVAPEPADADQSEVSSLTSALADLERPKDPGRPPFDRREWMLILARIDAQEGRVKEALAKLSGSIQLESTPGIGSTFTIRLPLRAALA